ncbi:MAG: hypothetical protein V3V96_16560 [Acidiferrobacterales bacterium]
MSDGDTWFGDLAGDNTERAEALAKFDSADAFFDAQGESAKKLETFEKANWRDAYAGDDDKFKSTLERFSTPLDMGKSFREAQATIRAGKINEAPGEDASEDDLKAWRSENGIPVEAKGYMENLPNGLVVGEDDKDIMGNFMETLHKLNVKPDVGHAIINWYNNFAEDQQDSIAEVDAKHNQEATEALRVTWGSDYTANINLVGAFLEASFGKEAKEDMMNGRFADGRAFMNNAKVLEGIASVQRKLDPLTQLIPPGGDPQATLNDEIAELEKFMREKRAEYNKDEKAQARLRQLYDIRLRHEEKTAA